MVHGNLNENTLDNDPSIFCKLSVCRALTADIVARQQALHPGAQVVRRDLVAGVARHLSDAHLAVFERGANCSTALGKDFALGSAYLDEIFVADIVVIGAPMHNNSIPSQRKGWIDRVCVAGGTLRYGVNAPEGLVKEKKVFVASSPTALIHAIARWRISIIKKTTCAPSSLTSV